MRAWGITDIGLQRSENQDSYAIDQREDGSCIVAVVCDGMGGVNGGKLASSIAVETFIAKNRALLQPDMTVEELREMQSVCVSQANDAVFARAKGDSDCHGMGTTLVSALMIPGGAIIWNVGDSRAYHIGRQGITRITHDHSVVENLVRNGELTPEQARTHPNRNLITRALGPESYIECDTYDVTMADGDALLLCSDGLVITVTDEEMLQIIREEADAEQCLARLLVKSKENGAPDNVTAVLIRNQLGGEIDG